MKDSTTQRGPKPPYSQLHRIIQLVYVVVPARLTPVTLRSLPLGAAHLSLVSAPAPSELKAGLYRVPAFLHVFPVH